MNRCVQRSASSSALLAELPLRGLERVLALDVEQAGRQLDEPHRGRVPVLVQHQHPLLVVDGQDHHGAGVLEHQPAEPLVGPAGRRDQVAAHRERRGAVPDPLHLVHRPGLGPVDDHRPRHRPGRLAHGATGSMWSASGPRCGAAARDSSIGNRSSRCRVDGRPTSPANSGCGRVGRERSSGCAWVAT